MSEIAHGKRWRANDKKRIVVCGSIAYVAPNFLNMRTPDLLKAPIVSTVFSHVNRRGFSEETRILDWRFSLNALHNVATRSFHVRAQETTTISQEPVSPFSRQG
jgi:hypothetical protein